MGCEELGGPGPCPDVPANKGTVRKVNDHKEPTDELANCRPNHHEVALEPGTEAPDIRLLSTPDQLVSLHEFRGRNVVLVFYPADWSPVCGDQTTMYNELLPEFHRLNAELLGISVDGPWCHLAFGRDRKLRFPLLADFEPKGGVARRYGVYRPQDGF